MPALDAHAAHIQHYTTTEPAKRLQDLVQTDSRSHPGPFATDHIVETCIEVLADSFGEQSKTQLGNRISFERHRMPNDAIEESSPNPSPSSSSQTQPTASSSLLVDTVRNTRAPSSVSTRSARPPTSPSLESRTPLTPEESPPYHRSTRKRATSNLEEDESTSYHSVEPSPTHSRHNSGDHSAVQVCICQPDPKIPRPRNAFILYRQHHQSKVIAEHPGLANPEISKIIGEQWRAESQATKEVWKNLANDEKARHQQQYPTYRYQPRRNTRRGSVADTPGSAASDKARCMKCGGRISAYPTPSQTASASPSSSALSTPAPISSSTPSSSRTLPVLGELSLQSPLAPRMITARHHDERDDPGPPSPNSKRRRYNNDQPVYMYRAMPPRYTVAPAPSPGPPYPFVQPQHHPYPSVIQSPSHVRRDSLPSLHLMSPSTSMAPPPRPGMGYQQHRMSQGHVGPDRSLTLPPLQTNQPTPTTPHKPSESKSVRETIMDIPLADKLGVLRRIAPPSKISRTVTRGPLIAIEGDDINAVHHLARWLVDTTSRDSELSVRLVDSPDVGSDDDEDSAMADYHMLAAEWLRRTKSLATELSYTINMPSPTPKSAMGITSSAQSSRGGSKADVRERDDEMSTTEAAEDSKDTMDITRDDEADDVDVAQGSEVTDSASKKQPQSVSKKPVLIIPAYSLHATNVFSCRIPITDMYGVKEHWQWSATLWRGIIGPDLTIYVKDKDLDETRRSVDFSEHERLFVVKRSKVEGSDKLEIDDATLRRVGFEISEWIRAYGIPKRTA